MMSDAKQRIGRRWGARVGQAITAGVVCAIFMCGALSASADEDLLDLGGAQPLPNRSLLNMRGGFMIGGFDISFGVTITATVDGATQLKTSFNLLNPNQISNETVALSQNGNVVFSQGASNANTTGRTLSVPLANAQSGNQSGQSSGLPNGPVLATVNGFNLVKLNGGGFALTSVDTTIIQNVTDSSVLSEVSNTANNAQIQTSLTADLFFNNFAQMAGRSDVSNLLTHLMTEQMNTRMLGP
jgi:hypothetical protein